MDKPASKDAATAPNKSTHKKLARLPPNYKITKRPLLRPQIPSKYAGPSSQKVVYISTRTPFMSAVKRVQTLLSQAEKRETQSATSSTKTSRKGHDIEAVAAALAANRGAREEVLVKGTGRAVEKTLGVGMWFQQREGFKVQVRTGSVGAVDDVEARDDGEGDDQEEEEVPESRVRFASVVEIAVSLAG